MPIVILGSMFPKNFTPRWNIMFFTLCSVEPQSLAHGPQGGQVGADGRANWGFCLQSPLFRAALLLSVIYIMNQAIFCLENGFCSEREGE